MSLTCSREEEEEEEEEVIYMHNNVYIKLRLCFTLLHLSSAAPRNPRFPLKDKNTPCEWRMLPWGYVWVN